MLCFTTFFSGPNSNENQPTTSKATSPSGDKTRVMIFAQYRDSVQEIAEMLNRHRPLIRCMSFIGQSSAGKSTKGFSQKEQLRVRVCVLFAFFVLFCLIQTHCVHCLFCFPSLQLLAYMYQGCESSSFQLISSFLKIFLCQNFSFFFYFQPIFWHFYPISRCFSLSFVCGLSHLWCIWWTVATVGSL